MRSSQVILDQLWNEIAKVPTKSELCSFNRYAAHKTKLIARKLYIKFKYTAIFKAKMYQIKFHLEYIARLKQ